MKKIIGAAVILLLLVLVLDGYSYREGREGKSGAAGSANAGERSSMPITMPADFDFSVRFGITGKNEVNTFTDEVTKDLVADGVAKAELRLTEEDMQSIYAQMRAIPITDNLDLSPLKKDCARAPYTEEHWTIALNGKIYTYDWSEEYCAVSEDAKKLRELRLFIFNTVKEKGAYTNLPEPVGGYD